MSDSKIFPLRLPAELREKLEREAKQGDRSITMEILRRLKRTFDEQEQAA